MRQDWLLPLVFGTSMLVMAQQAPRVLNTDPHTEPAGAGLSATVTRFQRSTGPLWLGYEVRAVPRSHVSVCSGETEASMDGACCGVYQLEESAHQWRTKEDHPAQVTYIDVLVRIEGGVVDRVRFVNAGCRLDAAGLPFTWLTDVKPEDSVAWLASLVNGDRHRTAEDALAALAMHETETATVTLADLASTGKPLWLRDRAAFWLGTERGESGLRALEKLIADPDPEFRKKLVFDLSVSHEPAATDDMIRMAKTDEDTRVREQGIFWVGQKAGAKAVATIRDAVINDPELGVKKKAVFALSQLPKEEAVPELLHVAQTNQSPELRKEAIFWLGQTHDARALSYFEQVLSH